MKLLERTFQAQFWTFSHWRSDASSKPSPWAVALLQKGFCAMYQSSQSEGRLGSYLLTFVSAAVPWVLQSLTHSPPLSKLSLQCILTTQAKEKKNKIKVEKATLFHLLGVYFCLFK